MRLAVIADLHANVPALDAVLAAIRGLAVDAIACLGDLVGYNAEPAACRARGRQVSVLLRDRDVVPAGRPGYVSRWC